LIGNLARDEVTAYAQHQGRTVAGNERWLSPNLSYRTDDN
jgi:5-methyltetrahydrofolate--homocysteine methyltransferase